MNFPSCPDCKTNRYVIEDTRNGRTTCSSCGLVVENTLLYEQSEWRNFGDKNEGNKADPNRIGGIFDSLLSDSANLSTFIGSGADGSNHLQKISQMHNLSAKDRKKNRASQLINGFAARMSLPHDVKLMARDVICQIFDSEEMQGKSLTNLVATILYISAKLCKKPRPLKELCATMCVKRKEVSRMHSEIMRLKASGKIKLKTVRGPFDETDAELFAVKYARFLELPPECVNASSKMAKNMHKLEIMHSHQPSTVAACIIWSIIKVKADDEKIYREPGQVADACGVSKTNFQSQFRKTVYPRLLDLIPPDYASKQEIARVPQ